MTIDARLVKIYNEYLEAGKEEDFIDMLYALLDMANAEIVIRVKKHRQYEKMKATRGERKLFRDRLEAYLAKMSTEERIAFLNRPWKEQPEWIQKCFTKLVKYPEQFNFLRIAGEVKIDERQNETFGARLTRYMEAHGMITSDEEGLKLHYDRMSDICNKLLVNYDLDSYHGKKAQKVRITPRDLKNYTTANITPKKDKLTALKIVTDEPMWWLGGYRDNGIPNDGDPDNVTPMYPAGPFSGKFRKKKTAEAS